MRKREITRDTVIRRELMTDGSCAYEYELILRECESARSLRIPLYSIRAIMTNGEGEKSEAYIRDAFADAGRAILLFDKIVRNLATPIDLAYIHEDEMS